MKLLFRHDAPFSNCKWIFFLLLFSTGFAPAQVGLNRFIDNPALRHASVGVSVVDLETGKNIVSYQADRSLTPASVMKLVTTATAIELLGETYRYETKVVLDAVHPDRILVIGSGDPTLGSHVFPDERNAFFERSAEALKSALKPGKTYSIYVVDNLFGYDGISPEWTWIDMGNYYAAGAYGISVFDNTYRLFFNTQDRSATPKILRTEPEIRGLTFINQLSLNSSGADNGYIYGAPFSYERSVRGNIPAGRAEFSIKGDIPDPGLLLGETFADYLSRAGFEIAEVKTAREDYLDRLPLPHDKQPYCEGTVIYTHTSHTMAEIIREVNVQSNNHYAEHLIRAIGRYQRKDIYADPLAAGIEAVHTFWKGVGISTSSVRMKDGCGLAPQNAVSPLFLTDLLRYVYRQSGHATAFFDSLPKAGEEGTLTNFMKKTKYHGKISAKSGSIEGVYCYAGYLIDGDKKYAFSVMTNKFYGGYSKVREAMEQFLSGL